MEIVVLNSDIARLVLDYLKSQKLRKATHIFCKTSPYLKQEFSAYKQGLQTHSFFPELEEIICEYVKISRNVEHFLPKLSDTTRNKLQQCNLSEKVNKLLLELAAQSLWGDEIVISSNDQKSGASLPNNKTTVENEAKNIKRKRNMVTSSSSSNEEFIIDKRDKVLTPSSHYSKKRRIHQPYCFLSKNSQRNQCYYDLQHSAASNEEIEESLTSNENDYAEESDYLVNADCSDEKKMFGGEKPNKESTPLTKLNKKGELDTPILPEISQAILDNPEFQQKLVENINQALNHSNGTKTEQTAGKENQNSLSENAGAVGEEISSGQILDQMIKNILDATEKEPSFDAIIQEVLDASNKPQVQTTAVQCNIDVPSLPVIGNAPSYTSIDPPPLVPTLPLTQIQRFPIQTTTTIAAQTTTTRQSLNIPAASAVPQLPPPRTPIILRSATANNSVIGPNVLNTEDPSSSSVLANNSFGQLIDPNFSISKLIVLNSNESAQKQQLSENCLGNTTADNLLNQMPTSGATNPTDEQVYFDTTTGQLTFPIFITNDGLVTNLPFLINNDIINQQLQTNNVGNSESSRLEMPLAEPIMVNANQFPPNSVIISSAQKEIVIEKQVTGEKSLKVPETKHCNTVPPVSLNDRLLLDKATPSSNGIVNTKAFRSLSTPRKRTSHVRTLTFSPRNPFLSNAQTPLSSRVETASRLPSSLSKANPEDIKSKTSGNEIKTEQIQEAQHEKAIIKAVEILPSMTTAASETVIENTNISVYDTDNIPPLFVSEEGSNQTIINKNVSNENQLTKPNNCAAIAAAQIDNTPKRKQYRKAAVRSCKRQISKSSSEVHSPEEKPARDNEKTTEYSVELEKSPANKDMMEEWYRLRNSNVDLDVRLREINASSQSQQQIKKVNKKKKVRRKKPAAVKKKEKELAKKAEELESSIELSQKLQEEINNESDVGSHKEVKQMEASEITIDVTNKPDKTPIECSDNNQLVERQAVNKSGNSEESPTVSPKTAFNKTIEPNINEVLEREKRSANMAFLLETPFKDPNLSSCNPPTPGIFAPSLETPGSKLRNPHDEMQASASFLFGSLTKSELDTPLMTAITPGFRFTSFGIKEMGTPKSVPGTDYSSGGSYYKPDASEDLDRNIDKILRNSGQKKTEEENRVDNVDAKEDGEILEDEQENAEIGTNGDEAKQIEIEIPVEKLRVEPIVLKRIKSFGSEANETTETAKIDPHYTLVSGLPEISAAEDECSSSSSSTSSSPSKLPSSSSSSSSPSSSSSSSSSSSNESTKSEEILQTASKSKKGNSINNLDNLSDISSTEDEEWQKLAFTDNDENSQLVSNDGEVRYPVRSWLTPIKEDITFASKTIVQTEYLGTHKSVAKAATIKVTLPLKSAEKRSRQVKELELKKERMKEKLKNDACTITKKDKPATTSTTPPNISAALAATRMMHAMRDKGKKPASQTVTLSGEEVSPADKEKRSLDVLTALNLSAKKQLPKTPESPQKLSPLLPADDGSSQKTSIASLPNKAPRGRTKVNITPITPNKNSQRKCLPIEARPVTRTIRKSGKKIVRTPLAFKVIHSPGKINSHSTTTTLAELAASKTVNKGKPGTQQTLRVSPRHLNPATSKSQSPQETLTPNTKVTTRSSKKPAANSKATKSRNVNKNAESTKLLEQQMEDLLDDWKDEPIKRKTNDEDFENETERMSKVPLKPKINLKARNALISTKPKKNIELAATRKAEEKILAKEKSELSAEIMKEIPRITEIPPQTVNTVDTHASNPSLPPPTTAQGDIKNCVVESDDDPLEDCEIKTIDESDTTSFIKCVYSGPDGPPAKDLTPPDFSNFHMVVAIDEYEKHVWHISEGICLFNSAPVPSNPPILIPKKRKIRATTVTTITGGNGAATTPITPSNTKITTAKSFATNTPSATSTPVVNQASNSRMLAGRTTTKNSNQEDRSQDKLAAKQQSVETSNKCIQESNNENQKIKIEDIESILSHLHGT